MVEAYGQSGMTQGAFASQRGMSVGTLRSWIYRRRREPAVPRLVLVCVATTTMASMEIALPRGLTLRVGGDVEPGVVATLVRAPE